VPQVEVAFDIDANGILSVSAKDKASGKEQKIVIKASSGLSEEEVKNMVKDAEAHAEEDRKFHEVVSARNHADSMIHATEKSLKELGDKIDSEEKNTITKAIEALKEVMKGNDKAEIERATENLAQASGKMAERMYAATGQGADGMSVAAHASGDAQGSGGAAGGSQSNQGEDVVDAEFEEVKENKESKR
jgi:molecular chaperone DnaK